VWSWRQAAGRTRGPRRRQVRVPAKGHASEHARIRSRCLTSVSPHTVCEITSGR